jgi:hypothetical protein
MSIRKAFCDGAKKQNPPSVATAGFGVSVKPVPSPGKGAGQMELMS